MNENKFVFQLLLLWANATFQPRSGTRTPACSTTTTTIRTRQPPRTRPTSTPQTSSRPASASTTWQRRPARQPTGSSTRPKPVFRRHKPVSRERRRTTTARPPTRRGFLNRPARPTGQLPADWPAGPWRATGLRAAVPTITRHCKAAAGCTGRQGTFLTPMALRQLLRRLIIILVWQVSNRF
jgi:hypothetical protein